jgi:antirestriction protein ArdC
MAYSKRGKSEKPYEPLEAPKRWSELLETALDTPGVMNGAFRAFHNYSFGNVMLAWAQLSERDLPLGPIATYKRWQALGRQVRRGEDSIILCQPATAKKQNEKTGETEFFPLFRFRKGWFALSQTDGDPVPMPDLPDWDYHRALAALDVTEAPFEQDPKGIDQTWTPLNGNVLGYFRRSTRTIHLSPLDKTPLHTALHELAHSILHGDTDGAKVPRVAKEIEAELATLLVSESLGLGFSDESRGYCQSWLEGEDRAAIMTDERSKRIIRCADTLLKAGQPVKTESNEQDIETHAAA